MLVSVEGGARFKASRGAWCDVWIYDDIWIYVHAYVYLHLHLHLHYIYIYTCSDASIHPFIQYWIRCSHVLVGIWPASSKRLSSASLKAGAVKWRSTLDLLSDFSSFLREDVWFLCTRPQKIQGRSPIFTAFNMVIFPWKKTHRNHHISFCVARHGAPLPNRHGGCHGATAMPGGQAMPWKPKDAIAQSDRHIFGMWTSWEFWVGTLEQKKCVSWYKLG